MARRSEGGQDLVDCDRARLKLEQYTTTSGDLELGIAQSGSTSCEPGELSEIEQWGAVVALVFQCDMTRVMTFTLGKEGDNNSHSMIGVPEACHGLSHHNDDPEIIANLATIQTRQCQTFADLVLSRLNEIQDVDGSTLHDNTAILYGNGVGDSHYHDNHDLPFVLFGATDTFAHGHHLKATDEPLADLHLAMCEAAGGSLPSLGGAGTGPLAGLT